MKIFIIIIIIPLFLHLDADKLLKTSEVIKSDELETNVFLGKNLDFVFKLTNNSTSKISTFTCFSIQNIDINTRLLFEFSILDKNDSTTRTLTTGDIFHNTDNCLKVIQSNSSFCIYFNLKYVFKNINDFDIKKENLKVHVDYVEIIESEFHKRSKDFILKEFSDIETLHCL